MSDKAKLFLFKQKGTFAANTGFGLIQGYLVGGNYFYTENLNVGFDIGSHFGLAPKLDQTKFSISVENNLHFGKENRFGSKLCYHKNPFNNSYPWSDVRDL